jgi:hypothetical protein
MLHRIAGLTHTWALLNANRNQRGQNRASALPSALSFSQSCFEDREDRQVLGAPQPPLQLDELRELKHIDLDAIEVHAICVREHVFEEQLFMVDRAENIERTRSCHRELVALGLEVADSETQAAWIVTGDGIQSQQRSFEPQ